MSTRLPVIVKEYEGEILADWLKDQLASPTLRKDLMKESEMREHSREFLSLFQTALQNLKGTELSGPEWDKIRELLSDISRARVQRGFTPTETATFIFSLKGALFSRLRKELKNAEDLYFEITTVTDLVDKLGLYTTELYQKSREAVIARQQADMLELSTPVVKLWEGILALPMIGTLDSGRTQVVMEALLQRIVETGATVAIIDITGVPTVDTLVAQHLMKTVAAARLMGADCIISGIRPQIAQTIVHLAVDLGHVVTKATLADAFALALKRLELTVTEVDPYHRRPESAPQQELTI